MSKEIFRISYSMEILQFFDVQFVLDTINIVIIKKKNGTAFFVFWMILFLSVYNRVYGGAALLR